jgi:branched-chain amino acid transport system ATP-binding protein
MSGALSSVSPALPDEPAREAVAPLLEAEDVWCVFGGVVACRSVSFEVPERALVSLIGPNGAGKTSFFNVLTGLYKPARGRVRFAGRDLTGARPDRILDAGVARTYQNIRLFSTMTALENVLVGAHARLTTGLVRAILPSRHARREERAVRERAHELLAYVGLPDGAVDRLATTLSYGDQRRVEIARALASNPRLLLLDEPTAGMNPAESERLAEFLQRLRDELGIAILLIEHDMKVVMSVSDRVTVLERGQRIAEGDPATVREDPLVRDAYLGTGA